MADTVHSITLGSHSLPPVADDGWDKLPEVRGVDTMMADGSVHTDLLASTVKYTYVLRWEMLTQAQYATVTGAWEQFVATSNVLAFSGLDIAAGSGITVTREPGIFQLEASSRWIRDQFFWNVTMKLRQV